MLIPLALPVMLMLSTTPTVETDPRWLTYPGDDTVAPGNGRRVVLVSGDEEYRSEEGLPMLARLLSTHGYETVVLFSQDPESGEIDPENLSNIPGLHLIDDADVLVLQLRFRELPDEDMKYIVDHVDGGKPVIGLRTSTHAFFYRTNPDSPFAHWSWNAESSGGGFGRNVLGETWVNHHGHHGVEATRGLPHPGNEAHPMLRGVRDVFGPTDVYGIRSLPEDSTVLLDGSVRTGMNPEDPAVDGPKNDPMHPVAWTRERAMPDGTTQRIFTTTMGTAEDFSSHDLRRLFLQGVLWCNQQEDAIPTDGLNAEMIGVWDPTSFGFGSHQTGRRPEDYRHGSPWVNERIAGEIVTRNAAFMNAVAAGDSKRLAAMYTEDAVVVTPGARTGARGREEIQSLFQKGFDDALLWMELKIENIHVVSDGSVIETGRYRFGRSPQQIVDHGSHSVVWRRVDDQWLMDRGVIVSATTD